MADGRWQMEMGGWPRWRVEGGGRRADGGWADRAVAAPVTRQRVPGACSLQVLAGLGGQ